MLPGAFTSTGNIIMDLPVKTQPLFSILFFMDQWHYLCPSWNDLCDLLFTGPHVQQVLEDTASEECECGWLESRSLQLEAVRGSHSWVVNQVLKPVTHCLQDSFPPLDMRKGEALESRNPGVVYITPSSCSSGMEPHCVPVLYCSPRCVQLAAS